MNPLWNNVSGNSWAFGMASEYPDSSDEEEDTSNQHQDADAMQDIVASNPKRDEQAQAFPLPDGFEDSQGSNGLETALSAIANRSNPVPRKQPLATKKSPRRDEDGEEGEDTLQTKRAKKTLFGRFEDDEDEGDADEGSLETKSAQKSLFGGFEDADDEEEVDAEEEVVPTPGPSGYDMNEESPSHDANIGLGMSSLNLTQDDAEENDYLSDQPFDGLGLNEALSDGGRSSDRGSSSPPPRRPEVIPYDLRTNVERFITGACRDVDRSGDYDPEEEARKEKMKKAKARERKKRTKSGRRQPEKVEKFIVRLRFRAFGTVLNITDNMQPNWPEGWSDDESDAEQEAPGIRYRERTPGWTPQKPIKDPKSIMDDITGHPFARGCKSCRRNGQHCSMIDGDECPCDQCDHQEIDCEPIILPEKKGKCNNCANNVGEDEENYCSFEMPGLKPHDVCRQCEQAGYDDCIPGNIQGYAVPRIDLDKLAWGPDRKHTSCTQCRMTKKKCTIKEKTDHGPCKQCNKAGVQCTFLDVPPKIDRRKKGHRKKGKAPEASQAAPSRGRTGQYIAPRDLQSDYMDPDDIIDLDGEEEIPMERSPSPPLILEDTQGRKGIAKDIFTCWAHPIEFNSVSEKSLECCFCSVPMFGVTGFCETKASVSEWLNGLGYTELHGGHRDVYDATVMCANCTISRLQTIICPGHQISRKKRTIDPDDAVEKLTAAEPQSEEFLHRLKDWCSFCLRVASHKCRADQPSLTAAEGDEQLMIKGCGLRLCENCEVRLRNEFGNSSTAMAKALDAEPKPKQGEDMQPGWPRADVEFLRNDSLLMKNVQAIAD